MKIKQLICVLLAAVMLLGICPVMAADTSGDNLKQYEGQHPRIFAEPGTFEALKEKIGANSDMKALLEVFLKNLDEYIKKPPTEYYLADLEDLWMRDVGDRIGDMVLAYKLTDDKKYLEAAKSWTAKTFTYPTWGRSAYENCDLACAHLLVNISLLYDWCYDDLSAAEKKQIVDEFKIRAGRMRKGSWWNEAYMQNHLWLSVAGLMTAAAAIYDVYPDAKEWFSYGTKKFDEVYTYLEDGASHEGYGYWKYGMRALVYHNEVSKKFLNKDYTNQSYLQKGWEYALYMTLPFNSAKNASTMGIFNFGDAAQGGAEGSLSFLSYQAGITGSKVSQWYANQCIDLYLRTNKQPFWWDFVFYSYDMEEEAPEKNMPTAKWFEELNYIFMRSDWSGDESAIAFRCGPVMGNKAADSKSPYDLGTGHVHSDVNGVLVFGNGEWILPDDGYVSNSSKQHNTLIVNGEGQVGTAGAWPKDAVAAKPTIDKFLITDDLDYVIGNGTNAYPAALGLNQYKRHFLFLKPDVLIVVDEVDASKAVPLELRFHPAGQTTFRQADGSYVFFGKDIKYAIKPFLEGGTTSNSAMITQNADKTGGKRDKLTIQVKNTTDNWVQATAISWADKKSAPKQVDMKQNGNILKFTIDDKTVSVNLKEQTVSMEKMAYDLNVKFNGTFLHFNDTPVIDNDRILIPINEFIDVLNLSTYYDRNTRDITLKTDGKEIQMKLLSNKIKINGQEKEMDAIPVMRNGSVYIPLRAVCEALDLGIYFDESASVANIITDASQEIGILGMFVNSQPAELVDAEKGVYACNIFDVGKPEIDILQLVNGTKADIAYTEGIYGEQIITLTSPDGKQVKKYTLETRPFKGLGEIGIANMSYSSSDGNDGENTIDGDLSTRWSAQGKSEWILYDFGKLVDVGRMSAAFYSGKTRKTFFEIQTSQDGENFTTILDTASSGNSEDMEDFKLKEKVNARYIRLLCKGNTVNAWNSISEVGFYAE